MDFNLKLNSKTKRILIIFFCIILLFGAWLFRWKQITTKTVKGVKQVYLTDRWTGQKWIKSIGVSNKGKLYDGDMIPYLSEEEIKARGKEILSGEMGIERKKYLQAKMDEAIANKEKVSTGHTQYVRLYEKYEEEYKTKYFEPLLPPKENVYERASKQLELLADGYDLAKADYISSKIPEKLKEDCEAWRKYDDLERKYWNQIRNIDSWANKEAEKILKAEAYSTKKIATYVWLSLLGIVFFVAGIQGFIYRKKAHTEKLN